MKVTRIEVLEMKGKCQRMRYTGEGIANVVDL